MPAWQIGIYLIISDLGMFLLAGIFKNLRRLEKLAELLQNR